jgi:hypothetical protein
MNRRTRSDGNVRVSVVIPFFNHGMVVEEALGALRQQSWPVHQIVVVDDGSTDSFSLNVLARLADTGVAVVRQKNGGPGSARNLGIAHTDGDAVLFLDSDDVVTEHHVRGAVTALADAPSEVAFIYSDMQFMGNERHQVVMPPYNLFLLLHRNFCSISGALIDRSVFDAGFRFRSDLLAAHEDWDFFITLGLGGLFGLPLHESPLGYRRWGYSRSDGVNERSASLSDTRDLHPELNEPGRLIAIKREWAPALTVVVSMSEQTVAPQTCDDFEIVVRNGVGVPPTRGRWVLVLDEAGLDVLDDDTFVERVLRIVSDQLPSAPVALQSLAGTNVRWQRVSGEVVGPPFGVVAEGHYYLDWSKRVDSSVKDVAAFRSYLDATAGTCFTWAYAMQKRGETALPLSTFRASRPPPETPVGPVELSGSEVERGFRHHEALPLFMPATGAHRLPHAPVPLRDGLEAVIERAWANWMPARSIQLSLVVDVLGQATFETTTRLDAASMKATTRGPARIPLGLLWNQPFPDTACLSSHLDPSTQSIAYQLTREPPTEPDHLVLGYVPTVYLPGRIELQRALAMGAAPIEGPQRVTLPSIVGDLIGVFLEGVGTDALPVNPLKATTGTVAAGSPASPHAEVSRRIPRSWRALKFHNP